MARVRTQREGKELGVKGRKRVGAGPEDAERECNVGLSVNERTVNAT